MGCLRIIGVEAIPVQMATRLSGLWSGPKVGTESEKNVATHVVIKIHSDDGLVGIGESQPTRHGSAEETTATGIIKLTQKASTVLINNDPHQRELLFDKLDQVVGPCPATKAGIDTALFDLIGKWSDKPMFELLGGNFRDKLPVEFLLTEKMAAPDKLTEEAAKATKLGYAFVELKVGADPKLDVQRVCAAREALGNKVSLKVDVNARYPNASVAIQTIRKMEKYGVEFVEQPLDGSDIKGMAKVTAATDLNIIADTTALTLRALVENVVRRKAADAVHIKLCNGGIAMAMKMISVAEAAEIIPIVGASYAFGVGIAAAHQIAATMQNLHRPDHYGRPYYADDILSTPIKEKNGYVSISRKAGLGVDLEESKVTAFTRRQRADELNRGLLNR